MAYLRVEMIAARKREASPVGVLLEALEDLSTVSIGQEDDLKLETSGLRIWLSRVVEGELAVEVWMDERWQEVWRGTIL